MSRKKIVKVSLYNGIFEIEHLPPGVEVHLVDKNDAADDSKVYPNGVRRARFYLDRAGDVIEEQDSRSL